ncbi:MAG: SGNH/GDSL hydrolase family protein, partial [Clostridia bacterium]|nr:SGNH/GDSL hydrolase family protein [Clostridia bacterium]
GSGSQTIFFSDQKPHTGRIFYRVTHGGKFNYSLLFSNIIDTTFADGSVSRKNLVLDSWDILGAKLGICRSLDFGAIKSSAERTNSVPSVTMSGESGCPSCHITVSDFADITFDGKKEKEVAPGEFFATDPLELDLNAGEYICFEITFSGKVLPFHAESIVPAFVFENGKWEYSKLTPFPAMIGIDRKAAKRVCYIGDSITQGCGTAVNSYTHWNAVLSAMLPPENAYWNLGYGYARGDDAASNGAWLFKAKQNDYVVVCFGVNDIFKGFTADQIKFSLTEIVDKLHDAGVKVLIQTIPPFDFTGAHADTWRDVNNYIRTELNKKADAMFDDVAVLSTGGPDCPTARYGGHPNAEGCAVWANALKPVMEDFLSR